jgi:catechol 2,3-dioxygenase-like lactoylglutathione lyase family enzyme
MSDPSNDHTAQDPSRPEWLGVNHLALVTTDMDATVRFWHEVLGAEIVATVATPDFKHYFFRIGEAQTIAFFEYHGADVATFAKPAGIPYEHASQFDHLSLGLPDEQRSRLRQRRLENVLRGHRGGRPRLHPVDLLLGPHGIALEASWWTSDLDDSPVSSLAQPSGSSTAIPSRRCGSCSTTGHIAHHPSDHAGRRLEIRMPVEGI